MRCTACGAELILSNVARDAVPGVEHHTFICSECHVTERRVVLMRHGREDDTKPVPMHSGPVTEHASEAQVAPGLFGRVLARIRGH
jgi:hypothetical protein